MMRGLVLAGVLAFCAQVGHAQSRVEGPAEGRAPAAESVKQKIRTLRAYALTDALALDEATASRLFPTLAKWDDAVDKVVSARVDLTRKLRTTRNDAELDRLIDAQVANQRALWDIEERRIADVRKILTPAQTARLLVVLPSFERKLQNQLRKAIRGEQHRDGGAREDRREQRKAAKARAGGGRKDPFSDPNKPGRYRGQDDDDLNILE